eukprot:5175990-Alexandrium_andersonii.AAC.1
MPETIQLVCGAPCHAPLSCSIAVVGQTAVRQRQHEQQHSKHTSKRNRSNSTATPTPEPTTRGQQAYV